MYILRYVNLRGMYGWLTEHLKQEIKRVFQPRYKRELHERDIVEIAENLTGYMEVLFKHKWKEKYDSKTSKKNPKARK